MFGRLKWLAYLSLIALCLGLGEQAHAASGKAPTQQAKIKDTTPPPPQPPMFKIVNGKHTVYLLGSIHKLPPNFAWRTAAIDRAIEGADVFMFEANLDFAPGELHYFMDKRGYLPPGKTLHQMLSPEALKQYIRMIAALNIDPNRLDYLQPGVAFMLLQLQVNSLGPGVDATLNRYAKAHGKQIGSLESLQSQFEALTALGGGSQVTELEKALTNPRASDAEYEKMLAAWADGDLAQLSASDVGDSRQRALLLDDRNRAWVPRIESMLTALPGTYLVTVGALHLAGARSVVDLLCTKGWKVQRVQTGLAPPPVACRK